MECLVRGRRAVAPTVLGHPPGVLSREFAGDTPPPGTTPVPGSRRPRKAERGLLRRAPPPTAASSASKRVPPYPSRGPGGQYEPSPGPVGTQNGPLALCGYPPVCDMAVTEPTLAGRTGLPNTTELSLDPPTSHRKTIADLGSPRASPSHRMLPATRNPTYAYRHRFPQVRPPSNMHPPRSRNFLIGGSRLNARWTGRESAPCLGRPSALSPSRLFLLHQIGPIC